MHISARPIDPMTNPARPRVLELGMNWFAAGSGGLDRVFSDLVRALPAAGVEVTARVARLDPASRTSGEVDAFASGPGMAARLLGARRAIASSTRGRHVDVVSSHFALYAAPGLDRLRGVPLVMHFHGPWAEESRCEGARSAAVAAKHVLERTVYRRADRVLTRSRAFADIVRARYGVDPARVMVVPGSVDLARFNLSPSRAEAREVLGWPTDRPILLAVRRLAARMGLDRLLEAMIAVRRAVPDVLLYIGGRGHMAAALARQAHETGLGDTVRFLGFLPEATLPLAFRAADINVVPSSALEGFGLTAAEALAAGTPSMVTPVGGLPEVVSALDPALVFASSAPADLAAGLIAALRGTIALPEPSRCRAYAERTFDVTLAASRTASIYREVLR